MMLQQQINRSVEMQKVLRGTPEYYQLVGKDNGQPLYLMANLATSCSFRCPKCAFGSGGGAAPAGNAIDTTEWQRLIELAADSGVKALVVAGLGEPTENFTLISRIIKKACEKELDTVFFTTTAGITDQQIKFYLDHRATLIVSLDSVRHDVYRRLTGGGDLDKTLRNIEALRIAFPVQIIAESRVVRLGINTTIVSQNAAELADIQALAGNDFLYVANPPMHRGRFAQGGAWSALVGETQQDYNDLATAAKNASETKSHASVTEGLCGWFYRGVSVDYDGKLISCGYASETRGKASCEQIKTPGDFLKRYESVRRAYQQFAGEVNRRPSCPLRDPDYTKFTTVVNLLDD